MEAGEEDREPLVQGVDHAELAVLLQVRPGRCVLGDAEGREHAPVALVGIGRHPGAGTEVPDCLLQGLVPGPAPVCQAAEPVSGIVGAAGDADVDVHWKVTQMVIGKRAPGAAAEKLDRSLRCKSQAPTVLRQAHVAQIAFEPPEEAL